MKRPDFFHKKVPIVPWAGRRCLNLVLRAIVRYCKKICEQNVPREYIRTRCLSTTWDCYCYRSALRKDNTIQHTKQCQRGLKYFLAVFVLIVRSISYTILPYYGNVPVVQLKVPIMSNINIYYFIVIPSDVDCLLI